MTLYIILGILIYVIISVIVYFVAHNEEPEKKWLWTIFWPIGIFFEVLANGFFWF